MYQKITNFIIPFIFLLFLNQCNIYKPTDARKVSPDPRDRVKRNLEEGRGLRLSSLGRNNSNFQFASSNPLWRAGLDVLEFAPLINANYSGGIIITDWISSDEQRSNDYYKITLKFLSNEIRSDAIEITLHEKKCDNENETKIQTIDFMIKKNKNHDQEKQFKLFKEIYEKKQNIIKLDNKLNEIIELDHITIN